MPKLIRVETDYRFYAAELTDEQYALYQEDEDQFWDEYLDWDLDFDFTRDKDGGTDYHIED